MKEKGIVGRASPSPPGICKDNKIVKQNAFRRCDAGASRRLRFQLLTYIKGEGFAVYKMLWFLVSTVMFFSWSPRKERKEGDLRGRYEKAPPLKIPPPPLHPASKNVPIFERLQLKKLEVFSR